MSLRYQLHSSQSLGVWKILGDLLIQLFYRWENWGPLNEKWLSKVAQLMRKQCPTCFPRPGSTTLHTTQPLPMDSTDKSELSKSGSQIRIVQPKCSACQLSLTFCPHTTPHKHNYHKLTSFHLVVCFRSSYLWEDHWFSVSKSWFFISW